jgi:PhnB protein
MALKHRPDGYSMVTPYLVVADAEGFVDFVTRIFDAEEGNRMSDAAGAILHTEVRLDDSRIMVANATAEWPPRPGTFYVYVEDVDRVFAHALAAGATSLMEPADQFYGDRHGGVLDSNGNQWWIATRVEEVSADEAQRRLKEQMPDPTT